MNEFVYLILISIFFNMKTLWLTIYKAIILKDINAGSPITIQPFNSER